MANKNFSKSISMLRRNNNLTMQDLAEQLGVTKSAVSMWENKGVVPREDILMSISKKYSISIDKLLGNNIEENDDTSDAKLSYLQRGLGQMDEEQLKKAENMLKLVFDDIFDDEEGDDDDYI